LSPRFGSACSASLVPRPGGLFARQRSTRSNQLITPGLDAADQHAYDDSWGVGDSAHWNGHGTLQKAHPLNWRAPSRSRAKDRLRRFQLDPMSAKPSEQVLAARQDQNLGLRRSLRKDIEHSLDPLAV
jgi:hypothetical protein